MKYDSVHGMAHIVVLTQWLMRLQQGKALKDKVDVSHQKDVVLKVHIQEWIDEAFLIMAGIEAKLMKMKVMHDLRQGFDPDTKHSAERAKRIQWTIEKCVIDLHATQAQLDGLHAKITVLAQ